MHLLNVDRPGGKLVQGFVRAEWPSDAASSGAAARTWAMLFGNSVRLWSQLNPLSLAMRLEVTPGRGIASVFSFVTSEAATPELRAAVAAFMRTDHIGSARTTTAYAAGDIAEFFQHPDELRIALAREDLATAGGHRIIQDVRIGDCLQPIVRGAMALNVAVAYEMQATAHVPSRDSLRDALYGIAHFVGSPSAKAELAADQSRLGERLKRAGFHMEECLSFRSESDMSAVRRILGDALSRTVYGAFDAAPTARVLTEVEAEPFAYHVHSALMDGEVSPPIYDLAACVARDDIERLLLCRGFGPEFAADGPLPALMSTRSESGSAGPAIPPAGLASGQPFMFVSYARKDADLVYPIVEGLGQSGSRIWIDRNLIGGDEWVAELEDRIRQCLGVIAFLTPQFLDSRTCRREVLFADALGKVIIPVMAEPTKLEKGLAFVLQDQQYIDISAGVTPDRLVLAALKKHAPQSFTLH